MEEEFGLPRNKFVGMFRAATQNESIALELVEKGYKITEIPHWFKFTESLWLQREKEKRKEKRVQKKRGKKRKTKVRVEKSVPEHTLPKAPVRILPENNQIVIPVRKVSDGQLVYRDESYQKPISTYDIILTEAYLESQKPKPDPIIELMKYPNVIQIMHDFYEEKFMYAQYLEHQSYIHQQNKVKLEEQKSIRDTYDAFELFLDTMSSLAESIPTREPYELPDLSFLIPKDQLNERMDKLMENMKQNKQQDQQDRVEVAKLIKGIHEKDRKDSENRIKDMYNRYPSLRPHYPPGYEPIDLGVDYLGRNV